MKIEDCNKDTGHHQKFQVCEPTTDTIDVRRCCFRPCTLPAKYPLHGRFPVIRDEVAEATPRETTSLAEETIKIHVSSCQGSVSLLPYSTAFIQKCIHMNHERFSSHKKLTNFSTGVDSNLWSRSWQVCIQQSIPATYFQDTTAVLQHSYRVLEELKLY